MGVTPLRITPEKADGYGVSVQEGVLIYSLSGSSPSYQAGIPARVHTMRLADTHLLQTGAAYGLAVLPCGLPSPTAHPVEDRPIHAIVSGRAQHRLSVTPIRLNHDPHLQRGVEALPPQGIRHVEGRARGYL